ncbi:MAG: branched-chain amino acid ABC transporter permease [Cyanothece sp. SIO2G6]|nr:branched-chain amino acid ABC transporter permease [Cyanothece sp. SIO2G6]
MDPLLIQLLINGVALGSIIALAAAGLTLTFGILRLPNFAHGDFMTLGAYFTLMLNGIGFPFWLAVIGGGGLTVGGAVLIERIVWQHLRDRRVASTTLIITSLGLALFLRNGMILIWGAANQSYALPVVTALRLGDIRIAYYRVVVMGLAVVAIAILHAILQYTKVGKAMRAVADNIDLARISGINVERVILWTWVLSMGLTAVGGSMYGLITAVRPNMGWFLILPMFASVILGGIGNPYGAIAGAFVIGITQEVSTYWMPSEYKIAVALILMVLVLLFKPQGLFQGTM